MNIFLLATCLRMLLSLSMSCIVILCIKYNYYTDIILFFMGNNRNNILPVRNVSNITSVRLKKEIEMIYMNKYVVIQSPDQQISIGIEVEPLSI